MKSIMHKIKDGEFYTEQELIGLIGELRFLKAQLEGTIYKNPKGWMRA